MKIQVRAVFFVASREDFPIAGVYTANVPENKRGV